MLKVFFRKQLRRSDAREQLLEQYYRTCRRHSGLTTESQFQDTTGQLDLPVDETDTTSSVGFSHNSLREYLVADAFSDHISNSSRYDRLNTVVVTETITSFFSDLVVYSEQLPDQLSKLYRNCNDSNMKERLFKLIFGLIIKNAENIAYLGDPPGLSDLDLSGVDFSGLPLRNANFSGSILPDTDLRNSDLQGASFSHSILDNTMLDNARIQSADFSEAEIESIFVFDEFESRTYAVLHDKNARQWLFSHGAIVKDPSELNHLLGKPWYEAAREVAKTLTNRIAGSHRDSSLSKGTDLRYRDFAEDFVKYLRSHGILKDIKRSRGSMLVKVAPEYRNIINKFKDDGIIDEKIQPFFDKYM